MSDASGTATRRQGCEMGWFDNPEDEPEYVGVYEDEAADECEAWVQTEDGAYDQCGEEATHTLVMRTHKTNELAVCDGHGTPDHVGKSLLRWEA